VDDGVAVAEGAALHILSAQTHVMALTQQSTERQRLGGGPASHHHNTTTPQSNDELHHTPTQTTQANVPVNAFAGFNRLLLFGVDTGQARVHGQVRRVSGQLQTDLTQFGCSQNRRTIHN
jgi:hypothetical protein